MAKDLIILNLRKETGQAFVNKINSNCMRGVNRVMLIGNLGKDPDVQFLDGNIGVAKFP